MRREAGESKERKKDGKGKGQEGCTIIQKTIKNIEKNKLNNDVCCSALIETRPRR